MVFATLPKYGHVRSKLDRRFKKRQPLLAHGENVQEVMTLCYQRKQNMHLPNQHFPKSHSKI
jgi:hypothetical protein